MNHPIIAGDRRRDASLKKALPILLPSVPHWITLGSDDERRRQAVQIGSERWGSIGVRLLLLVG
jgi:hypothetical protein